MKSPKELLHELLTTYFDGLYHGDVVRLQKIFHPQAKYACIEQGELLNLDMDAYFGRVETRIAPVEVNHTRTDKVIAIDFASDTTAMAKVECSIQAKSFVDYLSFLFIDNRWQIVSKVFHINPIKKD